MKKKVKKNGPTLIKNQKVIVTFKRECGKLYYTQHTLLQKGIWIKN